jgi:hypothetical protein
VLRLRGREIALTTACIILTIYIQSCSHRLVAMEAFEQEVQEGVADLKVPAIFLTATNRDGKF